jgi:hypothetical protein
MSLVLACEVVAVEASRVVVTAAALPDDLVRWPITPNCPYQPNGRPAGLQAAAQ